MKDLYLMRHGQTFFNQEGLVQGACDSPLTELGLWNLSLAEPTILALKALKNGTLAFLKPSPNTCSRNFDQEPPLLKTFLSLMVEKVWTKSVSACWSL